MRKVTGLAASAGAFLVFATLAMGQVSQGVPGAGLPGLRRLLTAGEALSTRTVVSHQTVKPGDSVHVAVEMTMAAGYWLYGPVPGGETIAVVGLTVRAGESPLAVGGALFGPTREHVTEFPDGTAETNNVYEGKTVIFLPVIVPADVKPGKVELPLTITWQSCWSDGCLPPTNTPVAAEIVVAGSTTAAPGWTDEIEAALAQAKTLGQWRAILGGAEGDGAVEPIVVGAVSRTTFGWLLAAVIAGLLINIMPCVLPVIPLRLLALFNQAKGSRVRFVTLGLAFAGGIVLFFAAVAGVNVLLRVVFQYKLVQADLFRNIELLTAMVLFLVALAANMFGVFTITVPGKVAAAETGQGHAGAVGMGFVMGVLSTPCSFALIAAVFGWAQLQHLWLGSVAFLLMGCGMAIPHAFLASFPGIIAKLPRAGRWTELFRQSVGFVLLGVAVWLLGTRIDRVHIRWVLGYTVVLAFCLWVWGTWVRFDSALWKKIAVRGSALALAVVTGWWMLPPPAAPIETQPSVVETASAPAATTQEVAAWQWMTPFDAGRIASARAAGKTVLVDFSASWCLECLVVKKKIYEDAGVVAELKRRGVLTVLGDVTDRDMPANHMLYEQLGQIGPPVTAVLPAYGGTPIVLQGVFSKGDLFEALDKAGAKAGD